MKFLKTSILFLAAALVSVGLINLPVSATNKPDYLEGQVLVKFKAGTGDQSAKQALSDAGGKQKHSLNHLGITVVDVPKGKEHQIVDKLTKNKNVDYTEVDSLSYALSTDPGFGNQWGLENTGQVINGTAGTTGADIDAPEAWAVTMGGGVKVAVLDTGIDQDHEDVSSKIVAQTNFTTSPSVDDLYGHGTHVAGIIAAKTNNAIGIAGVCPGCVLMNGKVLGDDGSGANSWVANGITWAADNGAKVINLSLGSNQASRTLESAVNYAWSKGAVVVAAAGNSGSSGKLYPAGYSNVIAVAATDNRDKKASFSSYGKWVAIAAPGNYIYSTLPNHPNYLHTFYGLPFSYGYLSGTSMATPMVSGTVALVWSTPTFGTSNSTVRTRLQTTADHIPGTGTYWQSGRANAARAVTP